MTREACDDANLFASCGDGVVDPGEECDDGNANNHDGCRNTCLLPFCGDGVVDPGEACDDGNKSNNDGCRNNCSLSSCGDTNDGSHFRPIS
jgi:cysteine-rich repeat protein